MQKEANISLVLLIVVYTVLVILIESCKVTKHSVSNQYILIVILVYP